MSFQKLNIIEPILRALTNEGYTTPTPIQEQAIPLVLQQKDLFGCARTGTGKTAAFAIPVLQLLHEQKQVSKEPNTIKALILTPTRELAIQILESLDAYGKFTGLRHAVIFGGVSQQAQVNTLRRGVDVLVATPGRLLDLIDQRYVNLSNIRLLILDEADRMLDMGFVHDVKKIIAKVPRQRQTLFFSATMAPAIRQLANTLLTNPVHIEITPVSSTAETVRQAVYFVQKSSKQSLLKHLLFTADIPMTLVFTRTKHGADRVARELNSSGISAAAIHGNKSQQARQSALLKFRSRQIQVLVATDIAARGIDIDELSYVINYDLPEVAETYVHRIGRTGRAGANGIAVSFCDHEEKVYLRDIEKLIRKAIPVESEHPFKNVNSPVRNVNNPGDNRPGFKPAGNAKPSGGRFRPRNRNKSGNRRTVKS
ncbi:DEAD/DEAH box helicase [Niastella yeongjuensis]|uniref:DEAD-box ATP-dependent RNA helicase RhpA n=1 Tax=Niastella yeongjuensis TaxID=354355 RepID=A0A1V9EUL3_9BACT|nr:DEAD/DEAH box helicase [Niastella yeongjuensis]OQP49771.1 DEAD/DEAH box helicase [Niastella yeongjuensis]SEP40464.1 ATP-dependent RNA helicase RhlE [Niastella yeongjuensis]